VNTRISINGRGRAALWYLGRTRACLAAWLGLLAWSGAAAEPAALSVSGITEPILDVMLATSVPGIVAVHQLKEGEPVKAGEVILELDKRLEELEAARRKLVMENRKTDLDATQQVFEKSKGVSKEELDKRKLEYEVAVVEHDMALEQVRRRLIVSPLTGTVVEIFREIGEACEEHQPLVRVVDTRQACFVGNLEPELCARLGLGETVRITLETGTAPVSVSGQVTFLAPVADPASGLLRVKARFDNPGQQVRPGLRATMAFD